MYLLSFIYVCASTRSQAELFAEMFVSFTEDYLGVLGFSF